MKILFFLLIPIFLFGNILKVASGGNDANTRAQVLADTSTNYWATLGRAVWGSTDPDATSSSEAAQAGDTVVVYAGTYASSATTTRDTGEPLYLPTNSGTSGNLIVFMAKTARTCTLTTSAAGMAVFGNVNRNYIEWNGFYAESDSCDLRAYEQCLVMMGSGTGNRVINCELEMGFFAGAGNNTPAIYVHTATNPYVGNNILDGSTGGGGENNSTITMYNTNGGIFEYNTVAVEQSGFYFKAPQAGQTQENFTIRYNIFYGKGGSSSEPAIRILTGEPDGTDNSQIYGNLIYDCNVGIALTPITDEFRDIDLLSVKNNTIDNCTYGFHFGNTTIFDTDSIYYNIISNCDYAIWNYGGEATTYVRDELESDYNCWYNDVTGGTFYLYGSNYSYADWQGATFGQDANSITGDPLYVNASVDSFQLQAASPCTIGVASANIGCYITGNEVLGANGVPEAEDPGPSPGAVWADYISNIKLIRQD